MKLLYRHQLTQSYWAGYLTAILYNNFYSRTDLPLFLECMRDYSSLKTVFGKYYNLLKINKKTNYAIVQYEKYNKMSMSPELRGNFEFFTIGYSDKIKKLKLKKSDIKYLEELDISINSSN